MLLIKSINFSYLALLIIGLVHLVYTEETLSETLQNVLTVRNSRPKDSNETSAKCVGGYGGYGGGYGYGSGYRRGGYGYGGYGGGYGGYGRGYGYG